MQRGMPKAMSSSREGPPLSASMERVPRHRPSTTPSMLFSSSRRTVRGPSAASLTVLTPSESEQFSRHPEPEDSVLMDEDILSSPDTSPAKQQRRQTKSVPVTPKKAPAETPVEEVASRPTSLHVPAPRSVEKSVSKGERTETQTPTRPVAGDSTYSSDLDHHDGADEEVASGDVRSRAATPPTEAPVAAPVVTAPLPSSSFKAPPSQPEPRPFVESSLTDMPVLPRRPASCGPSMRPRHVTLGRKELLGKGTFGMVYRAMDLDTNRIIAVKEVTIAPGTMRPDQLASLRREIGMMQKLDHPNIVKCLGEHWDGVQHLRIFMEYIPGGTISAMLRSFGALTELQASKFTQHMLLGLAYLHDKRIAHRDLKGDNLLVDIDGTLKLADFGTAKELATQSNSVAGTAFFMAPEVIRGVGHGVEADVWSAACCVVEMLSGKPPFSTFSNQYAIMMHIADLADGKFPLPAGISPLCRDFLERCLRNDPARRATARELLSHEWILNPPRPGDLQSINVLLNESADPLGDEDAGRERAAVTDRSEPAAVTSINPMQTLNESTTV